MKPTSHRRGVPATLLLVVVLAAGAAGSASAVTRSGSAAGGSAPSAGAIGPVPAGIVSSLFLAQPAANFPAWDSRYHNYPEMVAHIHAVAAAHPDIVELFDIGTSSEGRTIWAAKVSDNVRTDEAEPEVLFDGLHHASEYLGAEMTIYILDLLASNYGGSSALARRVTAIVNTREIWIVFMVNPDGLQYTLTGDPYRAWRKNRQPTPGSTAIGTDLNRNYAYRWGCCGGSSGTPGSASFRGPQPWSAPETRAIRDLVQSRVIGGRQQITVAVTFHTSGRLVLWPYGYTSVDVPPDMTAVDHQAFVAMGRAMAATNGYLPMQWGDGRRVDGVAIDWLYGAQRIFSFLFELGTSDYIPDEQIGPETSRNRDAVLYLMEQAGCPYGAIGQAAQFCGPFFDDLEIDRGWKVNPTGTDTATDGAWQRGIPRAGSFQLGTAASGQSVLATGLAVGHDVDGGSTTVRSPLIHLPAGTSSLHLRYWVGLGADATADDGFRVRVVATDGAAPATPLVVRGDGQSHSPAWRTLDYRIPATLAGRDVAIELVATDAGADSTVEAGVHQVRVTAP